MKVAFFAVPRRNQSAAADPIQFMEGEVDSAVLWKALYGSTDGQAFIPIETKAGQFHIRADSIEIFRVITP